MAATPKVPRTPVPHADKAWDWFRSIGSPKYHVAPMVDQSELPFRMLCRKHGATAAYTPMIHARMFVEVPKYRRDQFTTCPGDRPLFAQFCGNDPQTVLSAARLVEPHCDAIDLNLGCPQRIAKRGRYGAFLMDDLPLIERIVKTLAEGLTIPVTVKIRVFDDVDCTVEYARMIEAAGAYLLAVHGRTREQKDLGAIRASWDHIKAVKNALTIPVLANGNIQDPASIDECLAYTGADGVLSAEQLLNDAELFSDRRRREPYHPMDGLRQMEEYCDWYERHPTALKMFKGHVFGLMGNWLEEHHDLRDQINASVSVQVAREAVAEIRRRADASGRDYPVPQLSERQRAKLAQQAALEAAIAAQAEESAMMAEIEAKHSGLAQAPGDAEGESSSTGVSVAEVPLVSTPEEGVGQKQLSSKTTTKCVVQ